MIAEPKHILETIKRSHHPLLCIGQGSGADGHASALGLAQALQKLGKQPVIVSADEHPPKTVCFLKGHETICTSLENLHELVLELDARETRPDELSYEIADGKLRVFIRPKSGAWRAQEASVSTSSFRHDLIIAIGAANLSRLGRLLQSAPDFFHTTPIINIDHAPDNEHFGHYNAVDVTASACGEVCHDLLMAADETLMDAEIATAFLAGMIAKTRSFKNPHVSPKTLQTAQHLMERGADREGAVHHLFRTRSVGTLRLWGRALARLKTHDRHPLVWTLLSQQDFLHAGAGEGDLVDVIDELISTSPSARVVVLIFENHARDICAIVRAEEPLNAATLCASLLHKLPQTNSAASREEVRLNLSGRTLVDVERELIATITASLEPALRRS